MTRLSQADLERLAELSQLELSPEDLKAYGFDVSQILSFIDQLKDLDLSAYQPTDQVNQLTNRLRPDELQTLPPPSQLLASCNQVEANQIKVQRVIE